MLQPSLKVDEPLAAHAVSTEDGRVISGLLVTRTDQEVVIKTAERQLVRIEARQVQDLRRSNTSLMPERLLSDLTAQEAADLLEYIRSVGSAK